MSCEFSNLSNKKSTGCNYNIIFQKEKIRKTKVYKFDV